MPIHFTCPHCRKPLSRALFEAGQVVACPVCRIGVLVPDSLVDPGVLRKQAVSIVPHSWGLRCLFMAGILLLGGWCWHLATMSTRVAPIDIASHAPDRSVTSVLLINTPMGKAIHTPRMPPTPGEQPSRLNLSSKWSLQALTQPRFVLPTVAPRPTQDEKVVQLAQSTVDVSTPAKRFASPVLTIPRWSDAELRRDLLRVTEVNLKQQTARQLLVHAFAQRQGQFPKIQHAADLMVASQADLRGLPFRKGPACELGTQSAQTLNNLSQRMRLLLQGATIMNHSHAQLNVERMRSLIYEDRTTSLKFSDDTLDLTLPRLQASMDHASRHNSTDWRQPAAVPTLTQMLQTEDTSCRVLLVDLLGQISGEEASQALARRAVFDLSREVRTAAVAQLKQRPATEYRNVLLAAFEHPWPPVAYHAAEAVCTLQDQECIPVLRAMLNEPEPGMPFLIKAEGKETMMVREVVRVNHLANCLMCHAPSFQETDMVRGKIPVVGQPLDTTGSGGYGASSSGTFVRADITYLQQDFSVMQPVPSPGFWPKFQRFDYLVRLRPPSKFELLRLTDPDQVPKLKHRRTEAIRLVLRKLDPTFPAGDLPAGSPGRMQKPEDGQPAPKLRRISPDNEIMATRE